jgi:hypothetical protein
MMADAKTHRLPLNRLSHAECICFAQQVTGIIPSAKALHVAESVVVRYKNSLAVLIDKAEHLQTSDCIAIRAEMDELYEDITATVDAFNSIQPSQEITYFIFHLNNLVDRTRKAYRQRIRQKAHDG